MRRKTTAAIGAIGTSVVLVVTGFAGAQPATAATTHATVQAAENAERPDARMGDYSATAFSAAAAQLPDGIDAAIAEGLGLTPEQYLAESAAAVDGAAVVGELKDDGVDVVNARVDGTELVVQVKSSADARAVVERGGTAVISDEDATRETIGGLTAYTDLLNGTGWGYPYAGSQYSCSIGFNGFNNATGASELVTAGHCIRAVNPGPVTPYTLSQSAPGPGSMTTAIGAVQDSSFMFGGGYDSGRITVTNGALTPQALTSTWGWGQGSPTASRIKVTGSTAGIEGAGVCKSGITSGWTCGRILAVDVDADVSGHLVNTVISDACALPGDSGGTALIGFSALGVTSGGDFDYCGQGGKVSAFFPMVSQDWESIQKQHTNWQPAYFVEAPVVSGGPARITAFAGSTLSGTVPSAGAGTVVRVYIDGSSTAVGSATVGAGGAWSVALGSTPVGAHTYRAVAGLGSWNRSAAVTGDLTVVARPAVSRIAGSDRYAAAVEMSKAGFPGTAPVVYLVCGEKFPDALSAAPAATKQGGPLLLTPTESIPEVVRAEIQRLAPAKIVIVGGVNSVSAAAAASLSSIATVDRISGDDRYATSRAVVSAVFGASGAPSVYIATGSNFPDALSASGAAGRSGSAVLMVPGDAPSLDSASLTLVTSLHPSSVKIAGGPNGVSEGIKNSLSGAAASVIRLGASDRFGTSQVINADAFTGTSGTVFVASGMNFPDALAGAALAGKNSAPLYVTQTTCLSSGIAAEVKRLNASSLTLLGGVNALDAGVENLTGC